MKVAPVPQAHGRDPGTCSGCGGADANGVSWPMQRMQRASGGGVARGGSIGHELQNTSITMRGGDFVWRLIKRRVREQEGQRERGDHGEWRTVAWAHFAWPTAPRFRFSFLPELLACELHCNAAVSGLARRFTAGSDFVLWLHHSLWRLARTPSPQRARSCCHSPPPNGDERTGHAVHCTTCIV